MQARLRIRIWIMMGLTNRIPAAVTMGSRPGMSMQQAAKSKRQGMNRSLRLPSLRVQAQGIDLELQQQKSQIQDTIQG